MLPQIQSILDEDEFDDEYKPPSKTTCQRVTDFLTETESLFGNLPKYHIACSSDGSLYTYFGEGKKQVHLIIQNALHNKDFIYRSWERGYSIGYEPTPDKLAKELRYL